jgi:hypothetical protein
MLMITVIAFSVVLGYANNFMTAQRKNTLAMIQERLVVEDIWFHPNGTVTLYIANTGTIPLEITEIHVDNQNTEISPSPLKLSRLELGEANLNFAWIPGNEYAFTIITNRGYSLEVPSTPL